MLLVRPFRDKEKICLEDYFIQSSTQSENNLGTFQLFVL